MIHNKLRNVEQFDGEFTDELPGALLRSGRDTATVSLGRIEATPHQQRR